MEPWVKLIETWKADYLKIKDIIPTPQEMAEHGKKLSALEAKCSLADELALAGDSLKKNHANQKEETDAEMKKLWQEEEEKINLKIENIKTSIMESIIPNENESVILEIRAGEGGEEAGLFAAEILNMYSKWAKNKNWKWVPFSVSFSEIGGVKEAVAEIEGQGLSAWMMGESGVHCVKRVPKTEKKGRIHTSTVTVAILPEPKDLEIVINEKDLKIDVFRSSGPGGQSVNTTDSAVRIRHIPTGLVVSQQDEKSQHRNKEKAMKVLKARLFELKQQEIQQEQSQNRKKAMGRAKRTERIRTYHFVQNWVKDERVNFTCYNVEAFMNAEIIDSFAKQLMWIDVE